MSETPIGDQVMGPTEGEPNDGNPPEPELLPGTVRGVQPHATSEDAVIMTDPYHLPGEDDPDEPGEEATEGDELVEPTDNSGEPEAGDEPQDPNAVTDNAAELDSGEPAPDGQE